MSTFKPHRRDFVLLRPVVTFSLVFLLVGLVGRPAMAQAEKAPPAAEKGAAAAPPPASYVELRVNPRQKQNRLKVGNILRAGKFGPGEKVVFERYYKTYVLARWSLLNNRTLLPAFRKDLRNDLRTGKKGEPHDHLNKLALDFLGNLAEGKRIHPAARFNAMLMIGDLNSVESLRAFEVPVPLPATLPVLVKTVDAPGQSDAVKVAALIGIMRHARLGGISDPEMRKRVVRAMFRLASSGNSPDRSADGHAWMRTLAVEVMGELKLLGKNSAVPRRLAGMVGESQIPFSTRCAAARALGEFNYRGAAGLDPSQMAARLGKLAVDACDAEDPVFSSRRLKSRLLCVWIGLTGVDQQHKGVGVLAAKPSQKKFVDALRQVLKTMLALFEDRSIREGDLPDRIEENREKLQKVLDVLPSSGGAGRRRTLHPPTFAVH